LKREKRRSKIDGGFISAWRPTSFSIDSEMEKSQLHPVKQNDAGSIESNRVAVHQSIDDKLLMDQMFALRL